MTETNYKWRTALFVPANQNTPENRTTLANIISAASGETVEDERKLFDYAARLSTTGELPVQVFGIDLGVTVDMRDDMRAFLDTLPPLQVRYYVRANTTLPQNFDGKLLLTNKDTAGQPDIVGVAPWDTQPFSMQDALADLFDERGLIVISEEN